MSEYIVIPLSRGAVAKVSPEDAERVLAHKWFLLSPGYAARGVGGRKNQRKVLMHRFLLEPPPGMYVDHINRDKLDNRRENLRLATPSQNAGNRIGNQGPTSSSFKGVFVRRPGVWFAAVCIDGRLHQLGQFRDEEEAARASDALARDLLAKGIMKKARLNFPD